jgi:hypothetical protein
MSCLTKAALSATVCAVFFSNVAGATPSVKSPIVAKGEAEIEISAAGTNDNDSAKDGKYELSLEFGYGVTDHWYTAFETEWSREPGERFRHEAVAWENRFQILPQGEYLVDFGFFAAYEFGTQPHSADAIKFGPLFQHTTGQFRLTANPFMVVEVGPHSAAAPKFDYGVRAEYLWTKAFNPGVEFYGKMGEIADGPSLSKQKHSFGPVVAGGFSLRSLGLPGKLGYEVGALFGVTDAAPAQNFKGSLEYEFAFD